MNGYDLSRQWFDFAFENPSIVKPTHGSLYFWFIELSNRLGWPKEFGSPSSQAMAACGISSYNTYKKMYSDLIEWGFIKEVKASVNQYQSCVIALSKINKAPYKALDKALSEHHTKHSRSTRQITDSINKPLTLNQEQETNNISEENLFIDIPEDFIPKWYKFKEYFSADKFPRVKKMEKQLTPKQLYELFVKYSAADINATLENMENYSGLKKYTSVYLTLNNWIKREHAKTA